MLMTKALVIIGITAMVLLWVLVIARLYMAVKSK
jgi:hypothetical protein